MAESNNNKRSFASSSVVSMDENGACKHIREMGEGASGICEECAEKARAKEKMKECAIM